LPPRRRLGKICPNGYETAKVPRMTVWFPSLPFARNLGAAPESDVAVEADARREHDTRLAAQEDIDAPAGPDTAPPSARVGVLRTAGISLVVGIVAATAVLFAGRAWLAPPPREAAQLQQITHATADLIDAQQAMAGKLRTLETEAVATGETVVTLDARLRAQATATATLQAAVAKLVADGTGPGGREGLAVAALFGVAAVQLHDAVAAGRPFDWELVNLRGIVTGPPTLFAALDRLAPLAGAGVATETQLAQGLRVVAQIDAQRTVIPLVGSGIELVGRMLGPTALPLPRNPTPELLTRASALLGDGDVAGSVRLLQTLDDTTATTARPVIVAAEQRAAALAAAQTLLDAARDGLRHQLKVAAGLRVQP
jgi:hypothetical protein